MPARLLPFGDNAVLVEFGDTISLEINRRVHALEEAILEADILGIEELVPTYRSLLIRFDTRMLDYKRLVSDLRKFEKIPQRLARRTRKRVVVPVVYGGEYGPDLSLVAKCHGLTEDQVMQLHSQRRYIVYMIGFVAGFPYLGEVAEEISTPRLETPRLKVPTGSVGIAERQTGIYPCEAPGGWQIIGRTPLRLFDPFKKHPALLSPGDTVEFDPISEAHFRTLSGSTENK